MKVTTNSYNPLHSIIYSFPTTTETGLSYDEINTVKGLLSMGGVHCDTDDEVVDCLEILHELGVLNIERVRSNNKIYFKVTRKYNE